MKLPMIIQGGMGVAISDWRLARSVAQLGQLGVVSGTGIARIMSARLLEGDPDGSVRRALARFPDQEPVEKILARYFVPGGKAANAPYPSITQWTLQPSRFLEQLTVIANFVEVYLAKEGHGGMVGINLLEKVQLPNMASLYGAMLAGVDVVLMGAGIPTQIPAILDALAQHRATRYHVDVAGAGGEDAYHLPFDPHRIFPALAAQHGPLPRPLFFPIISSVVLAQALLKRSEGRVDGFIVEGPLAGGHNAPPRGALNLNEQGEPIYGAKDEVQLDKIAALGLPFYLAGSYGSAEGLRAALDAGAQGIQVGTAFALCDESGMESGLRQALLAQALRGEAQVLTSAHASPTGFPFKVAQLPDTLADPAIYAARERICDMGFLRTLYKREDGSIGYRCPAEPVDDYVRKGGKLEETDGRVCLCNSLGAAAGYPQVRQGGDYVEPALITSGNDLVNISRFVPAGQQHYSARDVIAHLLEGVALPS